VPWFMVDDKLHSHKKAVRAGVQAMGLWVLAGSWSADHLTDGFVPDFIAQRIDPDADMHAAELVTAGLWSVAEKGDDNGWAFHEWEGFQPTKEAVEEKRAAARERMARVRGNKKDGSQEVRANDEGTSRVVRLTPALPSPSQPNESARKRGSRIPEDFKVDDDMRQWAKDNDLGHLDLDAIAAEFVDYWISIPGTRGVKLNWTATWRNWLRRKSTDAPRKATAHRPANLPEGW